MAYPSHGFTHSRSFRINPGRETLLYGPGDIRLTIPPQLASREIKEPATSDRLDMSIRVLEQPMDLFSTGLHTWVEGHWMGLYKAFQVVETHARPQKYRPPLLLDIPEPPFRLKKSGLQVARWQETELSLTQSSGWVLRFPDAIERVRSLGQSHLRIQVPDNAWIGMFYPIDKSEDRCMVTLHLAGSIPAGQVRMYVSLKDVQCFGQILFHGDRWGVTGLPVGLPATFFAMGMVEGSWQFGELSVARLQNQRLTMDMKPITESELAECLQRILN